MLQDIISKYKSGFTSYTELRAQFNSTYSLELSEEGILVESHAGKGGVSARIFENGAFGFAASGTYDDAHVLRVLEMAKRNAAAMSRYAKNRRPNLPSAISGQIPINYAVRPMDAPALRAAAEELKRYAETKYAPVKASVSMGNDTSEKLLVVHNGCDGRSNVVLGYISVTLEREGSCGNPVSAWGKLAIDTYLMDALSPKKLYAIVDEAHEKLLKALSEDKNEKVSPDGGVWDCILSPEFTGMLAHEAVGHTCEADAVIAKDSIAAAFMGKQVACELVSLTDFAYAAYGENCPIPLHIDDEGIACKDAPIIKDGILVGCMNNRDTAERLGIEPTGNARASEYYDEPIIRMRNTCFLPGTSTLADMIASIDKGYYLTRSGGGNGSLKGEFNMIVSEGYEIIKGKLGRPIRDTISAGIAWDALKTVDMVSSNFQNSKDCGICGKKQSIPTSQGGPEMKLMLNIGGN